MGSNASIIGMSQSEKVWGHIFFPQWSVPRCQASTSNLGVFQAFLDQASWEVLVFSSLLWMDRLSLHTILKICHELPKLIQWISPPGRDGILSHWAFSSYRTLSKVSGARIEHTSEIIPSLTYWYMKGEYMVYVAAQNHTRDIHMRQWRHICELQKSITSE